jgi:outer membrane lipoprotein-sorting protein
MRYLFLLITILLIFICGCSSGKDTLKPVKEISIQDLIKEINSNSAAITSLKAEGNISIESAKEANSGGFELVLKKPDSLNIRIKGPFGINAARVSVAKDYFRFYNALENMLIQGQTSKKTFSELLNINMSAEEIMSILSCSPDFLREGPNCVPDDTGKEDNAITLSFKKETETVKYWVNPVDKYIMKRCVLSGRGKLITEERYQNYTKIGKFWLPKSIQVIQHIEKQSLTLYYSEHKVNSGKLDFSFNVPDGIKIINWK